MNKFNVGSCIEGSGEFNLKREFTRMINKAISKTVTAKEAAELLGIGERTLLRECKVLGINIADVRMNKTLELHNFCLLHDFTYNYLSDMSCEIGCNDKLFVYERTGTTKNKFYEKGTNSLGFISVRNIKLFLLQQKEKQSK